MTSWRGQRGTAVSSEEAASSTFPATRWARALLTPAQNGSSTCDAQSDRAGDVAFGGGQPCSNSGQPLLAAGSE